MASENQEKVGCFNRVWTGFMGCLDRIRNVVTGIAAEAKKLAGEDPRRIIHALKVGLAITAVSLLYYFDFFYDGFGVSAMWAVMTVVVVFEFSVGATLGKGVNRAIATILGGALGVVAHRLASFSGEIVEIALLGLFVFLIASGTTFFRFFPKMRARYDYGLLIFILTFSLICVSGYREDEIINMAQKRVTTILVGGSATILISILIFPVWAGEDLHNITATNIEKIANFLEGFGRVYFEESLDKDQKKLILEYKSLFSSKGVEDNLVNFAKWEPRHGKFRYRHPWDQYLKIGSLTRECAYKIDALNGFLNSDLKTPLEIRQKIQESCTKTSLECSHALREIALGIKTMTYSPSTDPHIANAETLAKKLKNSISSGLWPETDLLDIIPAVTVASLLIEVVSCTVKIHECVNELSTLSKFKKRDTKITKQTSMEKKVKRTPSIEASHSFHIIVE